MRSDLGTWLKARCRLLMVASLLAGASVGGCGSDRESDQAGAPEPKATSKSSVAHLHAAEAATVAMKRNGWMVAGTIRPPAAFGDADCTAADDGTDRIDCSFGTTYYGNMEPVWFEVRMQPDGSLSKVLGSRDPAAGNKSSAQTAALLASDDFLQHAPSRTRDYACRRAQRVEPDGTRQTKRAGGQLCTTHYRVSGRNVQRYVEFATDGTVTRDYVVQAK